MAQQDLNHGTVAGDGTGGNLFVTFEKVQANFDELYQNWVNLSSTGAGLGASDVGVEDATDKFTGTDVEAVLQEIHVDALNKDAAHRNALSYNTANNGASLIGIEDPNENFVATTVEAALAESINIIPLALFTASIYSATKDAGITAVSEVIATGATLLKVDNSLGTESLIITQATTKSIAEAQATSDTVAAGQIKLFTTTGGYIGWSAAAASTFVLSQGY